MTQTELEKAELKEWHEQVIYNVVRVRTDSSGGSGTLIYSAPEKEEEYETFVLTNHHVVKDAIKIKERFDTYSGKNVKYETRDTINVENFKYQHMSKRTQSKAIQADVVAHNERYDLALVKLREIDTFPHIAPLYPRNKVNDLRMRMPVYISGCALGHDTTFTPGSISGLNDEVENMPYIMTCADIIFGNSGGALFVNEGEVWKLLGVPSRVPVVGMGSAVSFMGLSIHINTIYKFLEEEIFQFIYDSGYTSEQCAKMRDDKQKGTERMLKALGKGYLEDEKPASAGNYGKG